MNNKTSAAPNSTDLLATRILIGLVVGVVLGVLARWLINTVPSADPPLQWLAVQVLDPIGKIFLRLLFFVVVPLVFASLALGVLQLGRLDQLGKMAGWTFLIFTINMAVGVALGLVLMNIVEPGGRLDGETKTRMLAQFGQGAIEAKEKAAQLTGLNFDTLVEMFMPRNLLRSIVDFDLLPMILFALLFGMAATHLATTRKQSLAESLETLIEIMTRLVHWALLLAPIAVPAMIFSVTLKFGLEFLQSLAWFVGVVLVAMAIQLFIVMSALLKIGAGRSPVIFFRAIRTILITAFSTSSSNATLPTTIQVSREKLGISPSTAGFVLPLGATMNMSGTALYEGCVVLFVAQVYGIELSIVQQATLVILAVLSAVAVAGVPGASLPLIVGLLVNFGLPGEGVALILGIDRLLDMARTVLNVAGDVVTACIVDKRLGLEARQNSPDSTGAG
ncbi:MAG: dicarboxylate/amino acid:cation symporter [Pedosphaera sp.]|nr:dicarboxylate/amino acid:cation symporter [Pedosphaera sp.]